jgi:hypothetical protein
MPEPLIPLTTATAVREYLLTLLDGHLGTWKDGSHALWVGEPPSHLAPATGCQCIIYPVPSGTAHNTSNDAKFLDHSWDCRLVNIVPRDSQRSLSTVAQLLNRSAHVRSVVYIPYSSSSDGKSPMAAEQITFRIYSPGFVERL